MKKLLGCFLCVMLLLFGVSSVGATLYTIADYAGQTATIINTWGTATFQTASTEITYPSSGTGVFQPYVSIQANNLEAGMGTDAAGEMDNKRSGNPSETDGWTHAITVGDLYPYLGKYEFLIDINEPDNQNSLITITALQIYIADATASAGAQTGFGTEADFLGGTLGTLVYDLDQGDDVSILMDYSWWAGQGQNVDAIALIPMDLSAYGTDLFVYTYWQFGDADTIHITGTDEPSNAGFEEIIVRYHEASVPEPATMLLLGSGLLGLALFSRQRFK